MMKIDWVKEKRSNNKYHNQLLYLKTAASGCSGAESSATLKAALESECEPIPET